MSTAYDAWSEDALRSRIAVTEKKVIAGEALPRAEIFELEEMKRALFEKLREPKKPDPRPDAEIVAKEVSKASTLVRMVAAIRDR